MTKLLPALTRPRRIARRVHATTVALLPDRLVRLSDGSALWQIALAVAALTPPLVPLASNDGLVLLAWAGAVVGLLLVALPLVAIRLAGFVFLCAETR